MSRDVRPIELPFSPKLKDRCTANHEWNGVPLHRAQFDGENTLEVFAGTNAPQGGNAEHGARTVLVIHDVHRTHFDAVRSLQQPDERSAGFVVVLGGDAEAATFADALEFAAKTIRRQLKANHGGRS